MQVTSLGQPEAPCSKVQAYFLGMVAKNTLQPDPPGLMMKPQPERREIWIIQNWQNPPQANSQRLPWLSGKPRRERLRSL